MVSNHEGNKKHVTWPDEKPKIGRIVLELFHKMCARVMVNNRPLNIARFREEGDSWINRAIIGVIQGLHFGVKILFKTDTSVLLLHSLSALI